MKFLQIMLCSLTAAVAFSLGAVPNGDFQNGKEGWAGTGTVPGKIPGKSFGGTKPSSHSPRLCRRAAPTAGRTAHRRSSESL